MTRHTTYITPYAELPLETPVFKHISFLDDIERSIIITPDGILEGRISGTTFIDSASKGKVHRNWLAFHSLYDLLVFWKKNKSWFKNHGLSVKIDLDDHDCCADGTVTIFKNGKCQKMFSVPFNCDYHENFQKIYA